MYRYLMLILLASAAGCSNCQKDKKYLFDMSMARDYWKGGKFDLAMRKYEDAVEKCPRSYDAIVGLASADREWGLQKFAEAEDMYRIKKPAFAKREFQKAVNVHAVAQKLYMKAISMRPNDPLAYRELGILYYKRATSPYNYPYRLNDGKNRGKERDLAIGYLERVVEKEPKEYFAQRYLGLAYFTQGNTNKGRAHLSVYLYGMASARAYILKVAPKRTPDQRKDLAKKLAEIDKQLDEVKGVLATHVSNLEKERRKIQGKPDAEKLFAAMSQEILAIRDLLARYDEVRKTPRNP